MNNFNQVYVTGSSGFIGKRLVSCLQRDQIPVSTLVHTLRDDMDQKYNFIGNLLVPDSLNGWLGRNGTVVHLAYMWSENEERNLTATQNLLNACIKSRVRRFVHISTAAVAGRVHELIVNEQVLCEPFTEYGKTKLKIENYIQEVLRGQEIDLVVLRPTSVFGPKGAPLVKLCNNLNKGNEISNYLRACLFGNRSMNLLHVDNLVAAIRFVIDYPEPFLGDVFIVSDDCEKDNNYEYVENYLRRMFGLNKYVVPTIALPHYVLKIFLRLMSRNLVETRCRFDGNKLRDLGFIPPVKFQDGLKHYAQWYITQYN